MINPNQITNFTRTKYQLEEFWLFCIMVAGKNSEQTANKLNNMLRYVDSPFHFLSDLYAEGNLLKFLKKNKVGQYNRIYEAIKGSFEINLRTAHFSELIQIKGVGPKSAAFFLLHSRGEEIPVLDTHILKYLKEKGNKVPKSTPQNLSTYNRISDLFKKELASDPRYSKLSLAQADLEIWKSYSNK